jgi:PPOX class probable F420-dependent enzyme
MRSGENVPVPLTDQARRLVDAPNLAFLATLDEEGAPHVSPVWIDREDDTLLVNTVVGHLKDRNMRSDARVAVSLADRDDPFERVSIRARVAAIVEGDEADRHLDRLAQKYVGADTYPWRRPRERRVMYRLEPVRAADR